MSILSKNSYFRTKWQEYRKKTKNSYLRVKWRAFKQARKNLKALHTRKIIETKIKELRKKPKIKVAFLQIYVAANQNFSLFDKLLADKRFDPYFIVNPDMFRSEENLIIQYKRTYEELANKYGGGHNRVLNGYDLASNTFIDYTQEFDLMTTANPYDKMVHQYFRISYWAQKRIPIFYISYFYLGRCLVSIQNLKLEALNYVWKFFVENEEVIKLAHKHQIIKGANLILSGYPKMDSLIYYLEQAQSYPHKSHRLRIIIAPHHSIYEADTAIGSFLKYYDILYDVMAKNADIDFIFRPHPLLFPQLAKEDFWGKTKTQAYFDKVCALNNVTYSTNGSYLEVFANSSALIHDCGSFTAEYLYTHKPCAFLYRDNLNTEQVWTEFGRKCVEVHYGIHNAKDLDTFIESVRNGQDTLKKHRIAFAKNEVMINYPHATQKIYEHLVQSIFDEKE